jgi:hypothetical protein
LKKLPNFICVGAQKAGTTTLHDILKQHPDIYLPELKEAHFFDQPDRYKKGIYWWISTFYNKYKNEKIMGSITPEYLFYEEIPGMILKDLGLKVKIIIVLRNPVERAYSHYLMSVRRGFETMEFKKAIECEFKRIKCGSFERNHFSYISRSLYVDQIKRYFDVFGESNILLLSFEKDIVRNIDKTILTIENFLGIEKIILNTNLKSNSASKPRFEIINKFLYEKNTLKKILRPIFRSEILRIKIAQLIDSINQRTVSKEHLSESVKKEIMHKYFKNEITDLETLLNQNFEYWRNFEK